MKPIRYQGRKVPGKDPQRPKELKAPVGLDALEETVWSLSTFSRQVTALVEDAEKYLIVCATVPQNDDEEVEPEAAASEETETPNTLNQVWG